MKKHKGPRSNLGSYLHSIKEDSDAEIDDAVIAIVNVDGAKVSEEEKRSSLSTIRSNAAMSFVAL